MKHAVFKILCFVLGAQGAAAQDVFPEWPIAGNDEFRYERIEPDFEADGLYFHYIPGQDDEVALMCNHALTIYHAAEQTLYLDALDWDVENVYSGEIIIPDKVTIEGKEYKVTMMMYGAFVKSGLTMAKIPEAVKEIRGGVFGGCTNLMSVEFPKGLKRLPEWIFTGCTAMKQLDISQFESIGPMALSGCAGLETLVTTGSVNQINAMQDRFYSMESMGENVVGPYKIREIYVNDAASAATSAAAYYADAFTAEEYASTELIVPEGSKERFAGNAFWSRFAHISEGAYSGISEIAKCDAEKVDIYDVCGRYLGAFEDTGSLPCGIYILKSKSGIKKIYVR